MANGDILSDFGINLLEEEIDDVIFQTNEFLTDATFTGAQGPFWWILQMCMALAALFSIVMAAGIAYKMMVKHGYGGEPEQLVFSGLSVLHPELHRVVHP